MDVEVDLGAMLRLVLVLGFLCGWLFRSAFTGFFDRLAQLKKTKKGVDNDEDF